MGNQEGDVGPIINFATERVGLGPMRRDLLPAYLRWINDVEIARFVGLVQPMTEEQEARWFDSLFRDDAVYFTIYEMTGPRPIGSVGLYDIKRRDSTAELGVAIGESTLHGRGHGTEAVRLACDYGFSVLGLTNIMLRLAGFNERAFRAYSKVGFKEIGRRRKANFIGGQRFDEIYMDLLADEFESPLLAKRLTQPPRR